VTKKLPSRNKKALKTKLASALNVELKSLSEEFQWILIDDLVTAFESRFSVLSRIQVGKVECRVGVAKECVVHQFLKSGLRSVTY
jgi:hypothetical protein